MKETTFCICKKQGSRSASLMDSTVLSKSEISSLWQSSAAVQPWFVSDLVRIHIVSFLTPGLNNDKITFDLARYSVCGPLICVQTSYRCASAF